MKLLTSKPVALDSFDHIEPLGAKQDNTTRPEFNAALYALSNTYALPPRIDLRVLDLGCSGGGFVESLLTEGCKLAVGLEGCDLPFKLKRDAWGRIPSNLFTADLTEPFNLIDDDNNRLSFHVITAWEFMEHIATPKLPQLFDNIRRHLASGGLFMGTISTIPCGNYHQTIKPEWWWRDLFRQQGFTFNDPLISHFEHRWLRQETEGDRNSFGFVARLC